MTAKFEVNGRKITIEASMDTLNEIEGMARCKSNYCSKRGFEGASKIFDDWVNGIHDALDAKGFYNDVK